MTSLGLGVAALAAFLLLGDLVAIETVWTATLAGVTGAIAAAVRRAPTGRRDPWWALLAAGSLLFLANLLSHPLTFGPAADPVSDVLAIGAFPLLGVAILRMGRAQVPGGDRESAIDGGIVMVAMATVLATTVHHPGGLELGIPRVGWSLHAVIAPLLTAAIVAAALRLLFVGRTRSVSAWLILAAAVSALIGNVSRAHLVTEGTYTRGTWTDVFILATYVALGLSALHPSGADLLEPTPRRVQRLTHARFVVLAGALLVPPITLVLGLSRDAVLTGSGTVLVAALVLWRLSTLAVERDRSRRELQVRAERQQALAELGQLALAEGDLDHLRDDAVQRLWQHLDLERCELGRPPAVRDERTTVVPLAGQDVSLIAVHRRVPDPGEVAFLKVVEYILTTAFERHVDEQTLRWNASHDRLTGLPNRRLLFERLAAGLASHGQDGRLHALFLDLDGFKHVNDTHGHQVGDDLLAAVADRLRGAVRGGDTVARLAGDEFVVLYLGVDQDQAEALRDRLRSRIAQPFDLGGLTLSVGVSIGIATATSATERPEDVLARADAEMYRDKHGELLRGGPETLGAHPS